MYNTQFPLDLLRLNSIYNNPAMQNASVGSGDTGMNFGANIPTVNSNPEDQGFGNIGKIMSQMYTPENRASERYNKMIDNPPQDTKPGLARILAAMLVDYTKGGQAGLQVLNKPNVDRKTDWKAQLDPAQHAATLENQQNTNERMMSYQTATNLLRQRSDEGREKNQETQNKIRQQRADIYDYKTRHPNLKFDFTGPTVKIVDPGSGKVYDSGTPTGHFSDAEKYELQQANALERISKTGEQARETEGVRQTGRESMGEMRGWKVYNIPDPDNPSQLKAVKINEITGETMDLKTGPVVKPSSVNKTETPKNISDRQFQVASQLKNTNPELGQFITIGKPGPKDIEITPPSDGGFFSPIFGNKSPTKEQFDRINEMIYGKGMPNVNQPSRTGNVNPNIPKGRIAVQDKKGNKFTIPAEQLKQAILQGYTEIK